MNFILNKILYYAHLLNIVNGMASGTCSKKHITYLNSFRDRDLLKYLCHEITTQVTICLCVSDIHEGDIQTRCLKVNRSTPSDASPHYKCCANIRVYFLTSN